MGGRIDRSVDARASRPSRDISLRASGFEPAGAFARRLRRSTLGAMSAAVIEVRDRAAAVGEAYGRLLL